VVAGRDLRFDRFGFLPHAAIEPLDLPLTIYKPLCAGKKRMTIRADINAHLSVCGFGHENIAARARDFALNKFWVDSRLHIVSR
jgi:hypothetical protein